MRFFCADNSVDDDVKTEGTYNLDFIFVILKITNQGSLCFNP